MVAISNPSSCLSALAPARGVAPHKALCAVSQDCLNLILPFTQSKITWPSRSINLLPLPRSSVCSFLSSTWTRSVKGTLLPIWICASIYPLPGLLQRSILCGWMELLLSWVYVRCRQFSWARVRRRPFQFLRLLRSSGPLHRQKLVSLRFMWGPRPSPSSSGSCPHDYNKLKSLGILLLGL